MPTSCTRCDGTGFLNVDQIPSSLYGKRELYVIQEWIDSDENDGDAQVCDCCGDGHGWYGEPGEHYGSDDPPGPSGPYAYNGGLCECG